MASLFLPVFLTAFVSGNPNCHVIHFTADWCGPCKQMAPTTERLRSEGWDIRAVDASQHPQLAAKLRVQNLPTFVFIRNGHEVDRIVGVASYKVLHQRLTRVHGGPARPANHSQAPARPHSQLAVAASHASTAGANTAGSNVAQANVVQANHVRPAPTQDAMIIRGQSEPAVTFAHGNSPAPPAAEQLASSDAIERARLATVRIRVDEQNTTAYGTGTVVHTHGNEALVLTCGHLFRDMTPGSQLTVDLFPSSGMQTVPARLVDFKADRTSEDIGLITFVLPFPIEPIPVVPPGQSLAIGQSVFSWGCDHGDDPTIRQTKISNINRYHGPANVEIAGAPAVGRSGGGLFDAAGRLIGVCNAADDVDDEGIYAGVEVVFAQLKRLHLDTMVAAVGRGSSPATGSSVMQAGHISQNPTHSPEGQLASASHTGIELELPLTAVSEAAANTLAAPVQQIVCIITAADGSQRQVTIDRPDAALVGAINSAQH